MTQTRTIRLMGGLGNQLFQVAGGLHLTATTGVRSRFDRSWFDDAHRGGDTTRSFETDVVLRPAERSALPRWKSRLAYAGHNPLHFTQPDANDMTIDHLPPRIRWLRGYFQRAEYPLSVIDQLASRLLPVLDSSSTADDAAGAIGLHIRLGDYLSQPHTQDFHGVTPPEYFVEALRSLRTTPDTELLVFTDSPDIVERDYLPHLQGHARIAPTRPAWETLNDLSRCAAIVMSNSSLSWWSAFVATELRRERTRVIKPVPWFARPSLADTALSIEGWVDLPRITRSGPQVPRAQ